jgi:tRNA pseudouridine55 synthase
MKKERINLNAALILDKPIGMSSNQALQKAKRLMNAKKAGHTGSLDVLATGLLPICFGEATKFSQFLLDADKRYLTTACLGKKTTTADAEGEVLAEKPVPDFSQDQLQAVLKDFLGKIKQTPPMYSALKHQGQPLYKYARQGAEIERKSREVTIHDIELLSWEKPHLKLNVHCSKGTYIRTLVEDIGEALGCGAYVSELHRTAAGPFVAEQMVTMDELEAHHAGELDISDKLLPIDSLLSGYPTLTLSEEQIKLLYFGQPAPHAGEPVELAALYSANGFIGTGQIDQQGVLTSRRLLTAPLSS